MRTFVVWEPGSRLVMGGWMGGATSALSLVGKMKKKTIIGKINHNLFFLFIYGLRELTKDL